MPAVTHLKNFHDARKLINRNDQKNSWALNDERIARETESICTTDRYNDHPLLFARKSKLVVAMGYACYSFNIHLYGSLYPWFSRVVSSSRTSSKVLTCTPEPSEEEEVEEEEIIEDEEEDEEEDDGSSPTIEVPPGPGDGLSTGRKEKPGESRLEQDSGVPVELIVGCRLDIATSNLNNMYIHAYHRYRRSDISRSSFK